MDDIIKTLGSDLDIVQASTETRFSEHPKSVVHRGIYDYYISIDPVEHFTRLDEDQFLVLSGHSLGGAVTNLAALDLISFQSQTPSNFPSKFCSLFTLGAPPVLGRELCQTLSRNFGRGTHGRVYFDNDPVAMMTRGKSGEPLNLMEETEFGSVFKHTGYGVPIEGTGLLSHTAKAYVSHFSSKKPSTVFPSWATWEEMEETDPIYWNMMGETYFRPSNSYMLTNFQSFNFPEGIQRKLGKHLAYVSWQEKREPYTSPSSVYPSRFSDTLFLKIWNSERLA